MNGSWSYIGTDARHIPQNQPTMNYGWLQENTPDTEYHVVLHEFGHALGLIHEIQVPAVGLPWNKEAVYYYFSSAPYYWNKEIVDHEIFERYSRSYSNSFLDPRSIMNYHIPQEFIMSNALEIGWNTNLSSGDQEIIRTIYPY
jgi:serralysin